LAARYKVSRFEVQVSLVVLRDQAPGRIFGTAKELGAAMNNPQADCKQTSRPFNAFAINAQNLLGMLGKGRRGSSHELGEPGDYRSRRALSVRRAPSPLGIIMVPLLKSWRMPLRERTRKTGWATG
jgi:hypothetical protein